MEFARTGNPPLVPEEWSLPGKVGGDELGCLRRAHHFKRGTVQERHVIVVAFDILGPRIFQLPWDYPGIMFCDDLELDGPEEETR
jgi:hypothetical protein